MLDCGIHPGLSGLSSLPFFDEVDLDTVDLMLVRAEKEKQHLFSIPSHHNLFITLLFSPLSPHTDHALPLGPLRRRALRRRPHQLQRPHPDDPPHEGNHGHPAARLCARCACGGGGRLGRALHGRPPGRRHGPHGGDRLPRRHGRGRDPGDGPPGGPRPGRGHVRGGGRRPAPALHGRLLARCRPPPARGRPAGRPAARSDRGGHLRRLPPRPPPGAGAPLPGHRHPHPAPGRAGVAARGRARARAGVAADFGGALGGPPGAARHPGLPGVRPGAAGDERVPDLHREHERRRPGRLQERQPVCLPPRDPPAGRRLPGRVRPLRRPGHALHAPVRPVPRPVRGVVRGRAKWGHHRRLCGVGDAGPGDPGRARHRPHPGGRPRAPARVGRRYLLLRARRLRPDGRLRGRPGAPGRGAGARRGDGDDEAEAGAGG